MLGARAGELRRGERIRGALSGAEHHGVVNRNELRLAADREGIRPTSYDLNPGRLSDDVHCLAIVNGGWAVWFAERGLRRDEAVFDTEDEACAELLLRLTSDPTTRQR
jgi:hypothetical protein